MISFAYYTNLNYQGFFIVKKVYYLVKLDENKGC